MILNCGVLAYALTGIAYSGIKVTSQELVLGVEGEVTNPMKHETPPNLMSHLSAHQIRGM